jgi:hypothetical protein
MEQISRRRIGTLSKGYLERTTYEVFPSQTEAMDISIVENKSKKPLEDQEVNDAYYCHSQWRDVVVKGEKF